jgi:pyruvate kinase
MSIMIKTKIVCTIGPASNSYEKIEKLNTIKLLKIFVGLL